MSQFVLPLLVLCALSTTAIGQPTHSYIVPPQQRVDGLTQAEWSRAWWQWAGSFRRDQSPIADRTGELCDQKQKGNVWFLAGTYGTQRTVRTCTVPSGKYLFFPLINYVVMPNLARTASCESVTGTAAAMTNDPTTLILEIDGSRVAGLPSHRQATNGCFDMGALAEPPAQVFPSAANGYYVMLKPLKPGTHTLNFGGALPSMLQAVTYTLHVK